jgi:hypothetical protein
MANRKAEPLAWMPAFLAELAASGIVRRSVRKAGIALPTAYGARGRRPQFAQAWDDALAGKHHRAEPEAPAKHASAHWRTHFFEALAETSNVSTSAARANVPPRIVYKLRREEPEFADRWLAALHEGYDNLEMELLGYLRDPRGKAKVDVAAALRLLAAHRETVERHRALNDEEDEQATLDSIDAFIEDIRQRRLQNAAILLEPEPADGAD